MWIEISRDIFEKSDFKALNYLFQILSWFPDNSIPRYRVLINTDKIVNTPNFQKLKQTENNLEEFIDREFDEFILSKPTGMTPDFKITFQKAATCYNVEEAIRFFSQPVSIILENNKNDSIFVISIINHFDNSGKLKEHVKNGWIKFENAGGCSNLRNFLQGLLMSFEDLALKNNRAFEDYFRGIILLDSDKEHPAHTSQNIELSNALAKEGYDVHILKKRMMENYLPDEVFSALKQEFSKKQTDKSKLDWINAYMNLTEEQKDYLRIAGKGKLGNNPIFYGVSADNLARLEIGFKLEDFKNSFPLLFARNPQVNKTSLKKRCNSDEFEDIVEKISALL